MFAPNSRSGLPQPHSGSIARRGGYWPIAGSDCCMLSGSRSFKMVEGRIQQAQQHVDDLVSRSAAAMKAFLAQKTSLLAQGGQKLEKVNPQQVLREPPIAGDAGLDSTAVCRAPRTGI